MISRSRQKCTGHYLLSNLPEDFISLQSWFNFFLCRMPQFLNESITVLNVLLWGVNA
jgi:hypothetical protein